MVGQEGSGSGLASETRDDVMRTLEHEIAVLLRRVRRGIAERAAMIHPELNATSYSLLITLADYGPKRAAELADMFVLDKGSVSRLVHQLLELALIERTPDPNDGRASILAITDLARTKLAEMADWRRGVLDTRLEGWEASEIGELARGLSRFNERLAE